MVNYGLSLFFRHSCLIDLVSVSYVVKLEVPCVFPPSCEKKSSCFVFCVSQKWLHFIRICIRSVDGGRKIGIAGNTVCLLFLFRRQPEHACHWCAEHCATLVSRHCEALQWFTYVPVFIYSSLVLLWFMLLVGDKSYGWRDTEGNRSFHKPLALWSLSCGAALCIMGPPFSVVWTVLC